MRGLDRLQPGADIEAVEPAWGKAVWIGVVGMVRLQPVDEVARPISQGAHSFGAHVQPMRVQRRGVGHAGAEGLAALDQDRGLTALGQPRGQHGAREAAADDDHGQGGGVVHRVTTPEPSRRVKGIQIS